LLLVSGSVSCSAPLSVWKSWYSTGSTNPNGAGWPCWAAVRYEKGLAVKALIALAVVALVVLARLLYLA
jgi:hypothetical protein